ncbi:MAG: ABC transporter substrate-binding protein, partial [Bradyrhizobium sp.]
MRSVRIGLIIPQRGSAGLWAPSAEACGRLAVTELNRAAGIRRRPVELVVIDAGTNGASAGRAAADAVDELAVDGLVGMLPSYARDSV